MAEAPFAPCDVSLVARFDEWENAATAEARLLFFLSSWLELTNPRMRAAFPLHLACVGEPPGSVQLLAEAGGARVRVAPASPLLALEIAPGTGRVLVVENGTIALQAPDRWAPGPAGAALRLTPASKPAAGVDWPAVYAAAGVPAPARRINSARADLRGGSEPMWPFYQARSFWTADPAGLRAAWARGLETAPDERVALTVAAARWGALGRLPDALGARLAHWEAGALLPGDTQLFQAPGLFQGLTDAAEIRGRLDAYGGRVDAAIESGFTSRGWWTRKRARLGAKGFRSHLHQLFRRHAAPALRASGAYV